MRRALALLVAGSLCAGCYGPFTVTRRLYSFNSLFGSNGVDEGIFLALLILPVYELSALGDAIIFNSIDFWKGGGAAVSSRSLQSGDQRVVMSYDARTRRLRIDSYRKDKLAGTLFLARGAGGDMLAEMPDGRLLVSRTAADGRIVITRSDGSLVGRYDPRALRRYLN